MWGSNGDNCIVWDEGYSGHHAVPPMYRQLACESERVTVSARKYMKLLKDHQQTYLPMLGQSVPSLEESAF
jgi:hypothetical protein